MKEEKNSKVIGYLRVSTKEQDLEKNKADILMFSNDKKLGMVKWVEEKVSGTKDWRKRKLGQVIDSLNRGDTIVVAELSRLGRSLLQILEIINECRSRGVGVYAVKGGWELNDSMQSKVIAMVFGMSAEIERDLISERTKEALRVRKEAGMKLGRPKGSGKSKLDPFKEEIVALLKTGSRQNYIAKKYGVTPPALSQWIKKHGLNVQPDIHATINLEEMKK